MIYFVEHNALSNALRSCLQVSACVMPFKSSVELSVETNDWIVVAIETQGISTLENWELKAREWGASLLCVYVDEHEVIIGPSIREGFGGCLRCWIDSYYSGRKETRSVLEKLRPTESHSRSAWLNPVTIEIIANLAAERMLRLMHSTGYDSSVYVWDALNLQGHEYNFNSDPACLCCGQLPMDSEDLANVKIERRPKGNAHQDRLRDVRHLGPLMETRFVGRGCIISGVSNAFHFTSCAVAGTEVPLRSHEKLERCAGFASSYDVARTVCALEALERYAGAKPRNRRLSVRAPASSFRDIVIDARRFGLYSQSQYDANSDIIAPYDPERELDFVWAYSFQRRSPTLIPRDLAYYSHVKSGAPVIAIEGSNGAALGSCPEEAMLHGLFEVIERDSFLLTWYTKRRCNSISVHSSKDVEFRAYYRRLEDLGFQIIIRDITTEWGIPAVWILALYEKPDSVMPYLVCTAGAHPRPEAALRKAMRELVGMVDGLALQLADPRTRRYAEGLADNYNSVRSMLDHPFCYSVRNSNHDLELLLGSGPSKPLDELIELGSRFISADLGQELQDLVARILEFGNDVIVVDQSTPALKKEELYVYKTFILGAVPISFGNHLRRVVGLSRLVPNPSQQIGWSGESMATLNSAPHPLT